MHARAKADNASDAHDNAGVYPYTDFLSFLRTRDRDEAVSCFFIPSRTFRKM